tara:strand:- start:6222 stop:7862 length:1641 start_codon:yes stop_codon:yes gene_type:complete
MRKILVTSALPYANGSIHLGHLVEYLQTDMWVRNQKMLGNECIYVCADDAHGTPIMLKARELNISPETLIKESKSEHTNDFSDFHIEFDNYHTTHSEENRELSELIFKRLSEKDNIEKKSIEQFFDVEQEMFLPDRYLKGTCPKCKSENQYGDSCESCGATYLSTDLINPISVISDSKPIRKKSDHLFFKLGDYENFLKGWLDGNRVQREIKNKMDEWLSDGLENWDISRDKPYFGFNIPNEKDKFFYVWLDAPVGYIASFKNFCERNSRDYKEFWDKDSETELYHFIGKDIAYFHVLFWPSMLEGANFRTPTAVFCHGFLTVDGEKMSKSRGTFFNARTYLNHLNPEYLRYYFASRLTNNIEDIDLSLDDFVARVNSDLIGKIINIGSRCARFINKDFDDFLSPKIKNQDLLDVILNSKKIIVQNYEERNFSKNIRIISSLADDINKYLDDEKPWVKIKDEVNREYVHQVCSDGMNMFRVLIGFLKPVTPKIAEKVENILDCEKINWKNIDNILISRKINKYEPIIGRIDKESVEAMKKEAKGNK